jgi:hypothetical protein
MRSAISRTIITALRVYAQSQIRIKKEGCSGYGEPYTKTIDLYGNKIQSNFIGVSPS